MVVLMRNAKSGGGAGPAVALDVGVNIVQNLPARMFIPKTHFIVTTALAGVLFLRPADLAPTPPAPVRLAPDSLARAVSTGNARLMELCLAERFDVNTTDGEGRTALLIASLRRDHATAQRLLQLGANPDIGDRNGRTPLMVAAAQGDVKMLGELLPHSYQPSARDAEGRSAAYHAIAAHQYHCFDLLLPRLPTARSAGSRWTRSPRARV